MSRADLFVWPYRKLDVSNYLIILKEKVYFATCGWLWFVNRKIPVENGRCLQKTVIHRNVELDELQTVEKTDNSKKSNIHLRGLKEEAAGRNLMEFLKDFFFWLSGL